MASRGNINSRMAVMGLGLIDAWQGLAALGMATYSKSPAATAFWLVRWDVVSKKSMPALLDTIKPNSVLLHSSAVHTAALSLDASAVLEMVRQTAGSLADLDAPLSESGLDSLGAIELRNMLQNAAGKTLSVPATLLFEHPTVRQVIAHLAQSSAPRTKESPAVSLQVVLDTL